MQTNQEKANNAVKWIDELSTTDEKQGHGSLGDAETGYCCLGLGCKITGVSFESYGADSSEFSEKIGMRSDSGGFSPPIIVDNGDYAYSLIDLNDDCEEPFSDISKNILTRLDSLFYDNVAKLIKKHYNID
jgi:hypothetical protein